MDEAAKRKRGRRELSPQQVQEVQARIVDAARELFAEQGYSAVSMRRIAGRVGLSPMALYRYFPSKRGILVHIWADIFRAVFAGCHTAAEAQPGPAAAVCAYYQAALDYWLAHPDHFAIVYMNQDPGEAEEPFFATSPVILKEADYAQALLAQAGVPQDRIPLLHHQLICLLHGTGLSLISIPEMNWPDGSRLLQPAVAALLDAACNPAASSA